jgi:hypothetical protein
MKNGVFWVVTPCGSYGITTQKTPFFKEKIDFAAILSGHLVIIHG